MSNGNFRSKRAKSDYTAEVGHRIIQARKELGLNQEELAELAGVSQRSMQAYETGEVIPYRKMREIAEVLQVSPTWILHGEEDETDDDRLGAIQQQLEELTKAVKKLGGESAEELNGHEPLTPDEIAVAKEAIIESLRRAQAGDLTDPDVISRSIQLVGSWNALERHLAHLEGRNPTNIAGDEVDEL